MVTLVKTFSIKAKPVLDLIKIEVNRLYHHKMIVMVNFK